MRPRAGAPFELPRLIGVIHLRPLPGSPRFEGDLSAAAAACGRDAGVLAEAGFDGVIVENYGDAPFEPGSVPPITVAAMTRCALAARVAAPTLPLGINVLRNDAEAALGIAVATGASFVRVNVHIGARLTDQGIIEGAAHRTLRIRKSLGAEHVRLLCDVDVKHSAPLAPRPLVDEADDLAHRGGADALLVTGRGTGKSVSLSDLSQVLGVVKVPVYVASGVTEANLPSVARAYGVIVGSCLRADGKAGGRVDLATARRFVEAFRASRTDEAALDAPVEIDP
jgi:membrane complex biogenesis BtpA family protein